MNLWDWLASAKGQLALAGGLGGLVRWLTLRERPLDGLVSVIVGAIMATYVGPIALPVLGPVLGGIALADESRAGFSGFLIGVGGIVVSGFLIDVWRDRRARQREKAREGGK